MSTRREVIVQGLAGLAGLVLLPSVNSFANPLSRYAQPPKKKLLYRFAVVSDLHYAQPDTDFTTYASHMTQWLNDDHARNHLDLVIVNGDLVHNRPDLLPELRSNYLDKLHVSWIAIPGNHDFADAQVWKQAFGYEDRFVHEAGEIVFILTNTADTKGEYICPDYQFLKNSLDKFSNRKIVFIIMHIPPVNWLPHEGFVDCPEVISLLHSYPNVKAAFHGHDHFLDGVRHTGKLPHFFDSHIGSDWGTDYRGYRIVEVSEDYTIYTYQVNASQNPVLNSNSLS